MTYDADGNMTSAYHDGSRDSFRYDSTNRLIGTNTNAYTYNAENVRIRNLCGDSDTTYVYNTNAKLSSMLMKTTDGVVTKYVYGRGLVGEETNGVFKTYHFDYRGSTVAITDINGDVTDTFEYDTYGKLTSRTGNSDVIFLYNGRDGVVTDSNGLIYMRARYYSPELRRFVNADILAGDIANAVTLNRYAYANGNPVSLIDPKGLSADEGRNGVTSPYSPYQKLIIKTLNNALNEMEEFYHPNDIRYLRFHAAYEEIIKSIEDDTMTNEFSGSTKVRIGINTKYNTSGLEALSELAGFVPFLGELITITEYLESEKKDVQEIFNAGISLITGDSIIDALSSKSAKTLLKGMSTGLDILGVIDFIETFVNSDSPEKIATYVVVLADVGDKNKFRYSAIVDNNMMFTTFESGYSAETMSNESFKLIIYD